MIVTEKIVINGKEFIRTFSDDGFIIRKEETDEIYSEAIDPADSGRTYVETDELIEASESDYIAALNELGVSE